MLKCFESSINKPKTIIKMIIKNNEIVTLKKKMKTAKNSFT